MWQHDDCGCGGKGPSLERLIALAREQNLPTVGVKPAQFSATLKGRVEWALINRDGITERQGKGPNLILDQGLDQVAAHPLRARAAGNNMPTSGWFPIIGYAAVGTDNTAPAAGQTGLGAEVGRTTARFASDVIARPANGVYEFTKSIEFDYGFGNGNLVEWGFSFASAAGGNLFNRALFLDGGGSPEVVTKTDEFKLRLIYTLEVALSPVALTSGVFDIAGVGTRNGSYALVGGPPPSTPSGSVCQSPDLVLFSALARGELLTVAGASGTPETASIRVRDVDLSDVAYTDSLSYTNDNSARSVARLIDTERDAYVPGAFERTGGVWKFDTDAGNLANVHGFALGGASWTGEPICHRHGYVFALDASDEFEKDDEHTLTIGVPTVTWGRA